jgi:hypothetical protein
VVIDMEKQMRMEEQKRERMHAEQEKRFKKNMSRIKHKIAVIRNIDFFAFLNRCCTISFDKKDVNSYSTPNLRDQNR